MKYCLKKVGGEDIPNGMVESDYPISKGDSVSVSNGDKTVLYGVVGVLHTFADGYDLDCVVLHLNELRRD